jgi:hypothetical protein
MKISELEEAKKIAEIDIQEEIILDEEENLLEDNFNETF